MNEFKQIYLNVKSRGERISAKYNILLLIIYSKYLEIHSLNLVA